VDQIYRKRELRVKRILAGNLTAKFWVCLSAFQQIVMHGFLRVGPSLLIDFQKDAAQKKVFFSLRTSFSGSEIAS
jgi:hypothetical protein